MPLGSLLPSPLSSLPILLRFHCLYLFRHVFIIILSLDPLYISLQLKVGILELLLISTCDDPTTDSPPSHLVHL